MVGLALSADVFSFIKLEFETLFKRIKHKPLEPTTHSDYLCVLMFGFSYFQILKTSNFSPFLYYITTNNLFLDLCVFIIIFKF